MARFSSVHSVFAATAITLLLITFCVESVEASYWSDEVNRVRTQTASYYMKRMEQQPNVSALPSGLLFTIQRRGFGDRAPGAEDKCELHYTIYRRYPGIVENTHDYPYPVRRSPSQLIPGMSEAMRLMREGDRWHLYVPYQLAYGKVGNKEKKVAGLANLRVEMELYKCESASGKTSIEIDAYLAKYMKTPMPEKTPRVDYTDL
ncbi:hypothetical protein JKF63_05807 [Porcisia hertigi]|uniref:peptidylprolyl isomerase n=1 Tax=Porcisia hertigi TaxID=2761500 RepID=A0A836I992_9TRYP|nr:hypothetical protein JKF63_05807 [Porcisia hertigi]